MASAVSKGRALVSQRSQLPLLWTHTHTCRAKSSVGSPEFTERARELTFPKRKWGPRALREAKAGCPPYPPNGLFCGLPEPLLRGAGSPGSGPGPLPRRQDRSLGQHTKLCTERREQPATAGSRVAAPAHAPSSRTCPCRPGELSPQWAVHAWLPVIPGRGAPEGSEGLACSPCTLYLDSLDGGGGKGQDIRAEAPWNHPDLIPSGFPTSLPMLLVPRLGPPESSNCPTALGNQPRGSP